MKAHLLVCEPQATQQLGAAWTLMRAGTPGCPEIPDWLAQNLPDDARVGIDPLLHTVRAPCVTVGLLSAHLGLLCALQTGYGVPYLKMCS